MPYNSSQRSVLAEGAEGGGGSGGGGVGDVGVDCPPGSMCAGRGF